MNGKSAMKEYENILRFAEEHDVKFVSLAFCDIYGNQKNICVMPEELPRIFENGISFDASDIPGFTDKESVSCLLFPEPETMTLLPWSTSGEKELHLFCDIRHTDSSPFESDLRYALKKAVARLFELGYECKVGIESEFYLFKCDTDGNPTRTPLDNAGYMDISPRDKGGDIRREICLTLGEMGIRPQSSQHKRGPGQNEIDFRYSSAVTAVDNYITYRSVVKTLAAQHNLFASFMPKPFPDKSGSGLHFHVSLYKDGKNVFLTNRGVAESFIEGVLTYIDEITMFMNPLTNSYARFGSFEAPKYVAWSNTNRSQLVRIPAAPDANKRVEIRSADPSCSPYAALTLLLDAGIYGIEHKLPVRKPIEQTLYKAPCGVTDGLASLPNSLYEAVELGASSSFVRSVLPEYAVKTYVDEKRKECMSYLQADNKTEYEIDKYFETV